MLQRRTSLFVYASFGRVRTHSDCIGSPYSIRNFSTFSSNSRACSDYLSVYWVYYKWTKFWTIRYISGCLFSKEMNIIIFDNQSAVYDKDRMVQVSLRSRFRRASVKSHLHNRAVFRFTTFLYKQMALQSFQTEIKKGRWRSHDKQYEGIQTPVCSGYCSPCLIW